MRGHGIMRDVGVIKLKLHKWGVCESVLCSCRPAVCRRHNRDTGRPFHYECMSAHDVGASRQVVTLRSTASSWAASEGAETWPHSRWVGRALR